MILIMVTEEPMAMVDMEGILIMATVGTEAMVMVTFLTVLLPTTTPRNSKAKKLRISF